MKKLLAPFTLFTLAGIFLSSCSNTSKLSFTKRHYRSGYFVDHVGRNHIVPVIASIPLKPKEHIASPAIVQSERSITVNVPTIVQEKPSIIQYKHIASKMTISGPAIIYSNTGTTNASKINTKSNDDATGSSGDSPRGRDNISVPFIIIVLCAIFIPPLGVGLMYGLNSYFWIDLILTLLFFFPGMIFALIVVLM
jgi:uncharacterized membrane protein YqaE (UPF0057 family)